MKAAKVMIWMFSRLIVVTILLMLIITSAQAFHGAWQVGGVETNVLAKFLLWLATGGSVVAVSWIAERSKWFQSLESSTKAYVQYGASTILGVAALLIQTYIPAATLEMLAPYFAVFSGVFGMIFLNQVAHVNDPARTRLS